MAENVFPTAPSRVSSVLDVVAFIAVLATGLVLIRETHAVPDALGGYFLAIAGLFAAWRAR